MVAIAAADDTTAHEVEPLMSSQHHTPQASKHTNYQAAAARAAGVDDAHDSDAFSSSLRFHLLQLVLVASIVVYICAYMFFAAAPVQLVFLDRLADWWTEPAATPNGEPKQHLDMGRPTFLFLFAVMPFAVGTLAFEAMRGPQNLHRVVSRQVLRVGMVLRRKPSQFVAVPYLHTFSFGELAFLAFLLGGNVVLFVVTWVCMLHYYPLPGEEYTVYTTLQLLGVVFGYSCVYNMALLFLPATRSSAWMEFMGISYANGMKFHRWLGVATVVTAVGHGLPFYPIWYHNGQLWDQAMPCFDCSLDYYSKGYPAWFNVFGEISLFFLLVLAATSLPWIRRNMYETFYYAHYSFVPGVIFAVLHWNLIAWWLLPTFTIYLVDRVVGSTNAFAPVPIEECTVLGDGILKVVVTRSSQRGGDFEVGQFVYMNVPAISKWQWHAFTIGSSPRASKTSFTIWLKSLGDWTDDLVKYADQCAQKREQPTVFIDGYYGASLESYDQYATLCLIGGGIGVTPLFAMLEDIASRVTETPSMERWPSTRRIHFVFTFRELALLEEIHPVLQTLRSCKQTRDLFSFDFYLTRAPGEEMLDARLVNCLQSKSVVTGQTSRDIKSVNAPSERPSACPFAEPLRDRTYRAVLFATVIVASAAAIMYLDYDGGVLMDHGAKSQYWPLQNLVDCMVMFAIAPIAYLFILVEKMVTRLRSTGDSVALGNNASVQIVDSSSLAPWRTATPSTDVTTYRDLLAEYNVAVGKRPDMNRAMAKVYDDLTLSRQESWASNVLARTVGVFISGPEALKRATEEAVAGIDTSCFDIHDEEFEL